MRPKRPESGFLRLQPALVLAGLSLSGMVLSHDLVRREHVSAPVANAENASPSVLHARIPELPLSVADPDPSPAPAAVSVSLTASSEPAPSFAWPDPMPPRREATTETSVFPSLRDCPELMEGFRALTGCWFCHDFLDQCMSGPEAAFDGVVGCVDGLRPRPQTVCWAKDDCDPMWMRIFDFQRAGPRQSLFGDFFDTLLIREQRFLTGFADSDLYTFGVEDGSSDVNERHLRRKQRKILWESLRRTYTDKYRMEADEKLRHEALSVHRWSGMDYVIMPPLLSAYVYYRGFDKRISMGPTWVNFSLEPVLDILHDEDMLGALSVEWMPKGFPVGLLVSFGLEDGDGHLDFIGIGTSIDAARKALALQVHPRDLTDR